MHAGMMLRQLLNQLMFMTRPWQRAVAIVTLAGGGLAMIPAGLVLGHYGMSLTGVLILAVTGRMVLAMRRARRAARAAGR